MKPIIDRWSILRFHRPPIPPGDREGGGQRRGRFPDAHGQRADLDGVAGILDTEGAIIAIVIMEADLRPAEDPYLGVSDVVVDVGVDTVRRAECGADGVQFRKNRWQPVE